MIKFRPSRRTVSSSMKDEETFETVEEMLQYLSDRANRFFAYVGTDFHTTPDDFILSKSWSVNTLDLKNTHRIIIKRAVPFCIGYCGE